MRRVFVAKFRKEPLLCWLNSPAVVRGVGKEVETGLIYNLSKELQEETLRTGQIFHEHFDTIFPAIHQTSNQPIIKLLEGDGDQPWI